MEVSHRNHNGFPPTVCIELLKWCNLACPYCRSASSMRDHRRLEYDAVASLLKGLSHYGMWRVALTGGEPSFWRELPQLLGLLAEIGFPFSVTTNGLSARRVLEEVSPRVWANGTLYVSIDGNRVVHDSMRGGGTFDATVEFLRWARPRVPRLFVGTVLVADLKAYVVDVARILVDVGVDNWTLISPVNSGRGSEFLSRMPPSREFDTLVAIARSTLASMRARTTVTFLDFAEADGKYHAAVYVSADGTITHPGTIASGSAVSKKSPASVTTDLGSPTAAQDVYSSVARCVRAGSPML